MLACLVYFCFFSEARAENLSTSNCSTDGSTNYITGNACASGTHTQSTVNVQSGLTGGTTTGASTEVGTTYNGFVRFKHNPGSWAIQHAITQALAGSGLKIDGYRTTFEYRNNQTNTINGNCNVDKVDGVCIDPLTLTITAKSADGTHVYQHTFDYGQAVTDDWVSEQILSWVGNGQLTPGTDISTVDILLQGYDAGYWAGNYGPKVRNMVGDIIVSADICTTTPLHSASCPGYADAVAANEYNNQCNADALYDSGCPGYATAYYNQQCNADPLYDSGCSGYATAYYNQQCSADALYDSGCPGYATAHFNQQCSADALHDSSCPGYATAYYNQQCSADALYDSGCNGYAEAYYSQQCSASALYDSGCPGYETAYFNQQCSASALYDSSCPGYATAYLTQQCSLNTLYDAQCPGYETAYFNQQCSISSLYNSACPGYETAYLAQQCSISSLYDSSCTGYAEAYFTQQCSITGLYDTACPNYETAYIDSQCTLDATYLPSCTGYAGAIIEDDAIDDDGIDSVEDIIDDMNEIVDAGSITDIEITGDAVVDAVINDEPIFEVVEVIEAPVIEIEVEAEIVPVEIAIESAFDELPIIENFNSFVDAGPVIAPLASISAIEQVQDVREAEILIETFEAEVELEIAQLEVDPVEEKESIEVVEAPVEEPELIEVAVVEEENKEEETLEDIAQEEAKEDEPESTESETTDEDAESKEDVESTEEKEEVVEEVVEEEVVEEEVVEEVIVVKKVASKKLVLTKKQKSDAKKKKMKEIIKNKLAGLAVDLGKATSLKQQAEIQAKINALINFVPGFNEYANAKLPGVPFYGSEQVYKNVQVAENKRGLLNGLASQIKHEQMIDMQYK